MTLGPLEYIVLTFPGNKFRGEIAPALQEVVDKGIIRVIDLVLATKDTYGNVIVREFSDLDPETAQTLDPVVGDISAMLTEEDVATFANRLDLNSTGALLLFEHVWAQKLRDAIGNANGVLVDGGIIPHDIAEEAAAFAAAAN